MNQTRPADRRERPVPMVGHPLIVSGKDYDYATEYAAEQADTYEPTEAEYEH